MARPVTLPLAILGTAVLVMASAGVQAGAKKSDSEVKVSATATKLDAAGKQVVTVTLMHNKGWHTYANPVGNEDFEGNKTVVTISAKVKPGAVTVDYPVGKITKDKIVGDYKIYDDRTDIRATVQRARGDTSPLEISVRILACHSKGVCLLPATVKVTVP
jgi:DsbC/DsbD-like thiol-disulfide interchange protein